FLAAAPPDAAGIPKLRATFDSSLVRALALNFSPGDLPRYRADAALPALRGPVAASMTTSPLYVTTPCGLLENSLTTTPPHHQHVSPIESRHSSSPTRLSITVNTLSSANSSVRFC